MKQGKHAGGNKHQKSLPRKQKVGKEGTWQRPKYFQVIRDVKYGGGHVVMWLDEIM